MHVIVKDRALPFIVTESLSVVHMYYIFFICSPDSTGVGMVVLVTVRSCSEFLHFLFIWFSWCPP